MKKYKLIVNPAAGRGKANAAVLQVAELFKARGATFDLELTTAPQQAAEIARKALKEFDVIVAVGGDSGERDRAACLSETARHYSSGSGTASSNRWASRAASECVDIVLRRSRVIDAGRSTAGISPAAWASADAAVNRASYESTIPRGSGSCHALIQTLENTIQSRCA
jgi:hypothetical protein